MKHSHRFSKSRIFRRTWLVAITMVLTAFAKPYAQADPGFDRPPMDDKPMAIASKLADAIGLDEEATTKFIKTYAAYIRSLRRLNDRYDFYPGRNITEKQAQQNIDNRFRLSHEIIQLREQYYKKFKAFMTYREIDCMYMEEKKLDKRKHGKHGPHDREGRGEMPPPPPR